MKLSVTHCVLRLGRITKANVEKIYNLLHDMTLANFKLASLSYVTFDVYIYISWFFYISFGILPWWKSHKLVFESFTFYNKFYFLTHLETHELFYSIIPHVFGMAGPQIFHWVIIFIRVVRIQTRSAGTQFLTLIPERCFPSRSLWYLTILAGIHHKTIG